MAQTQRDNAVEKRSDEQLEHERETRLAAWRKPQLQRLQLSLDTALTKGSFSDGMFFTTIT